MSKAISQEKKKPNKGEISSSCDCVIVEDFPGKNKRLPKRAGYILEAIADKENILGAIADYCRGQRRNRRRVARLRRRADALADDIRAKLLADAWVPSPLHRFIHKDGLSGKQREICASCVLDNIVQTAIVRVVEPIIYRSAYAHSACNIKGKGIAHIMRYIKKITRTERANELRYQRRGKRYNSPVKYIFKFDLKKYYEHIKPELVEKLLRSRIKDERVIRLTMAFVRQNEPNGLCIGGRISRIFANFVGEKICRFFKERGVKYCAEYMDDFAVWGSSKSKLHALRRELEVFLKTLNLELKENWFVAPWNARGCDFCGYVFQRDGIIRIRKRIRLRIIQTLRRIARKDYGETLARRFLSYWGYIVHTKSFYLVDKYGGTDFSLKQIKEIAHHGKNIRRTAALD